MQLSHSPFLASEQLWGPWKWVVLGIHSTLQAWEGGVALQRAPESQPPVGVRWAYAMLCPVPAHMGALSSAQRWSGPAEAGGCASQGFAWEGRWQERGL